MQMFKFQGPDGKIHTVEAPDDATEDAALDWLLKDLDRDTPATEEVTAPVVPDVAPPPDDSKAGFFDSFLDIASPRVPDPEEAMEGVEGAGEIVTGIGRGAAAGLGAVAPSTKSALAEYAEKLHGMGPESLGFIDQSRIGPEYRLPGMAHEEAIEQAQTVRAESQAQVIAKMPEELRGRTFEENMADPKTAGIQAAWSVTSNLGPTGLAIGAGLAAGAAGGPIAGIAAAGSTAFALESGQSYTELKEMGVPELEAQALSSAVGAVNASLEIAPLGMAAKNIPGVRKLLKMKVSEILTASPTLIPKMMAAEGGTESIQQVVGNAAKAVYDENQELLEGVPESAFVGTVLGGVIGGVGQIVPTTSPESALAGLDSQITKLERQRQFGTPERRAAVTTELDALREQRSKLQDQLNPKHTLARDLHETIPDPQRILQHSETSTIQEREASMQTEATAQVTALEEELETPELEVEEIEAAPPPVSNEELRGMTVDEAMGTLTEGHDAGTLRMTPDEFNALVEDIKENGIREAITLETGIRPGQLTLTDGRHRLLAAKAAGLKAVPVQVDPQSTEVEEVPEVILAPEATEAPVADAETIVTPSHSAQEIARGRPSSRRLSDKYREIGGRRDAETKGWVFRSVDRKRVERAEKIFGESDVEAELGVAGSFQTYIRGRGLANTKLDRDEMKAVRSAYRASLASQRPQVQAGPSDLTTRDSSIDSMRYLFQDKFIDLKRVEEVAGPGRAQPYRAETLYHGRAAARVDDVQTNVVDPLTTILADNKIELQDLNDYMHALHAAEANAELERRNPLKEGQERDITALAGMSNERAAEIVAQWEGNEGMRQAAQYVRDLNDATADIIEAEGLEPGDVVQQWRDTYKNYVPLHRAGKASLAGKGKGLSIRGRESKARVGSEDQVVDIIGHSVQNHARAIKRAEQARVGREVLNFARENPDPDFWKVDPVETMTRFNTKTGLVETTADPTYQTKPNVFEVKEDGQSHHITFNENNPKAVRLAEALNGLDADQMGAGLQALRAINTYLSAVNTTYNPEFMLGNFFRDVQTAGIKMEATEIEGMQLEVAKSLPEAMKTIYRSERGKAPTTDMQQYHEEWRAAGGKTGWIDAHADVESRVKELENLINSKQTENKVRDVYKWTTGWMKDANSAVENAVRLSAYVAARNRGVTAENAAVLSKELTVNFNRKGAWGPAANAAWLFYNASVQGSANVLGSLRSRKVQKLVTGMAVGAFANAMLQREMGGEDEDGVPYWDKISPYEKERNMIVMNPWDDEGDYYKIPLPYGYNVFKVFGEAAADAVMREDYNALDAAAQVTSAALGSFNPVGSDASFLQVVAPTVLDPLAQIGENKQFYGAPVMPENRYGVDQANAELYFRSARETSVGIAKALNELTGGHKYKSGDVDLSPEWIDLMVDFVTGGAGRTVADSGGTMVDVLTGEIGERPLRRTPGLRKFYAASPETWTSSTYFEYKADVQAYEAIYKDAVKSKRDKTQFRADPRKGLVDQLKEAESVLREGYKERDQVEAKQPEGWEDKVERIEERIDKIRKRFIMMYREKIYPEN